MPQEVVMVMGYPASGKSSLSKSFATAGYVHLNRDKEGGKVASLLPLMEDALRAGKNVVLDNLFPTVESRHPFIQVAQLAGVPISCILMETSIEESIINALHRMWDRHGRLFLDATEIKGVKGDPGLFPIAVFFVYKKAYQKPNTLEGFLKIDVQPFLRIHDPLRTSKAVIFDYDDTLRFTGDDTKYDFPTHAGEVQIFPNREKKLAEMQADGYLLLGASNQAGVSRKQMGPTFEDGCKAVEATFDATNQALGADIDYLYCPHSVPPTCYCRKPQSGMGVKLVRKYDLDPRQCIYVGDQTTDKTFAKRLGMMYYYPADFFQ